MRPGRNGRIDLRRSARYAIRSSGELMQLFRRRPRTRRRPLVLICDVSGSMERYSRLLMIFAYAIARREDLEAFVFSTRLTRITRQLRQRDVDKALEAVTKGVHDFSGGTRIGDALSDFNRHWARRVLGHGAVVIIVSDGWDRGDPGQLAAELTHLRRSAHRLVWLNLSATDPRHGGRASVLRRLPGRPQRPGARRPWAAAGRAWPARHPRISGRLITLTSSLRARRVQDASLAPYLCSLKGEG
jgi:uncharacterized protein with von Willebrand factor type A (vWA) domain